MHLRGLGVIDDAVLEFGPGLTVVTGETGAGKTMVVTGLGLLMGGRGDPGAVRTGYETAVVEGRIVVPRHGRVAERAHEAGAELDGDELLVSRSVSSSGRSRAYLGGRGVPVATLIELAGDLVAVHGQSDQIRLQSPARQREALDRFGGAPVAAARSSYKTCWQQWRAAEEKLRELTEQAQARIQEADVLRLRLAEVERIQPVSGEDHALREQAARLAHADGLQRAAQEANLYLAGDEDVPDASGASTLLGDARHALEAMREHDTQLAGLADRLAEITYLVDDLAQECASYAAGVESDPAQLAAVEERRAVLNGLTRAHGVDVDGVLAWAEEASARLAELDGDEDTVSALAAEVEALRVELALRAAVLSDARSEAAARLGAAVTAELPELSMNGARLEIAVRQKEDETGLPVELGGRVRTLVVGGEGVDEIEMLLAPHAGAPLRPLGKGASGGELSRVMLGLEVVLGAVDPVPTFVFDEVDSGVGGSAALGIGRRLARLARHAQVLVVTHLPQVAAFADRHLQVVKSGDGEITTSGVRALDDDGRVRELARMLGGVADSGSAQEHARELLSMAAQDRAELDAEVDLRDGKELTPAH
ncbi:DNA repair protein RecN [Spongisporangium articulatum]|uniref:DNA repair protein RecN n=1 Tax=Spongisporangium articulatum TaxID=3362603 RepID=A0ABW8ASN4_9ACTN